MWLATSDIISAIRLSSLEISMLDLFISAEGFQDKRYICVADLYSDLTADENLYGKKNIVLPNPRFVIFYNGAEKRPEKEILRLSDLFAIKETEIELELTAVMLNINPGYNAGLLDTCKSLGDYSEYTYRVRKYAKEMELEEAVERAITECIRENILADFLQKYRAEAKKVSIYEYDEERHMRQTREEGYEEGQENGIRVLIETCQELGLSREEILSKILKKYVISEKTAIEFLEKYGVEAKKVSIYEYDEERHMRQTREEGYEEGYEESQENGIRVLIESCKEFGVDKEDAMRQIMKKYSVSEQVAREYLEKYWK